MWPENNWRKQRQIEPLTSNTTPWKHSQSPIHCHLLYSWVWPVGGERRLEGEVMGAHLLHSASKTTACQEIKQASSLPSVVLLLSLASPIYEATDPLFLPPWAITWRKCSDLVRERVGLVGGFAALNKASHLLLLYRNEGVTRTPKKACHFLSDAIACEIASLMACLGLVCVLLLCCHTC